MFKFILQILTALSEIITRAEQSRLNGQQTARFMIPITQAQEPTNQELPDWVREFRDHMEAAASPNPLINPDYQDMRGSYHLYQSIFERMCDAQLTGLETRMLLNVPEQ